MSNIVAYRDGCCILQALKSEGQNVCLEVVSGVDHFDLIERLSDPDYSLTQASAIV